MGLVIKKTIVLLAIFLVVPSVVIAINWQWHPESLNSTSRYLFWITETASFPWAIITSALFFILFCLLLPTNTKKKIILLWCILVAAVLIGQVVKSVMKSSVAESRPFVVWMEQEFNIDDTYFYSLPKKERKTIIHENLSNSSTIPKWLYKHWGNETGYSFPSGHTLFAATWAFLALVILGFRRHRFMVSIIVVWAILIEISRLSLGMHRPADLISSVIIAWLISLISYGCAKKWNVMK